MSRRGEGERRYGCDLEKRMLQGLVKKYQDYVEVAALMEREEGRGRVKGLAGPCWCARRTGEVG